MTDESIHHDPKYPRVHEQYRPIPEYNLYVGRDGFLEATVDAEYLPWETMAKGAKKGRPLLINDTFIRVDGLDYTAIRSRPGALMPIEVITKMGERLIQTPKCEGYVFAPKPRSLGRDYGCVPYGADERLMQRCMTPREVAEAERDHELVRYMPHVINGGITIRGEYYNNREHTGDSDAHLRLLAFNRALQKKREEYAKKKCGSTFDWSKVINATFKPEWFTLFPDQKGKKVKAEVVG